MIASKTKAIQILTKISADDRANVFWTEARLLLNQLDKRRQQDSVEEEAREPTPGLSTPPSTESGPPPGEMRQQQQRMRREKHERMQEQDGDNMSLLRGSVQPAEVQLWIKDWSVFLLLLAFHKYCTVIFCKFIGGSWTSYQIIVADFSIMIMNWE